jgi:hypothetical protein
MHSNGCITKLKTSRFPLTFRKESNQKKVSKSQVHSSIYKQISETFMYILQFHENHNRILREEGEQGHSEIIDCLVQLGRSAEEDVRINWFIANAFIALIQNNAICGKVACPYHWNTGVS